MRSKRFLLHPILRLRWCLKNKIKSRWERFAPSYNPFFRVVQITILAKNTAKITRNTHASHLETEAKRCLRRNQRRPARPSWVRCGLCTLWHDSKMSELAHSSRRRAQSFLSSHNHGEDNRATHSVQATRWARTRSCSRSPNLTPNSSANESAPSSQADPWEDPKPSPPLDPDTVPFVT